MVNVAPFRHLDASILRFGEPASVFRPCPGSGCAQSGTFVLRLLGNIESPGNTCRFGIFSRYNVPEANLHLGALGNNRGPTPAHLPLAGSALIDAGWRYVCTSLDQRGYVRADGNPSCDTGSVEAGALDDVLFRDGFDI